MIKIKDARPLYTGLFVTSDEYSQDDFNKGIVLYGEIGRIKPFQKVFKVGPFVKNVKEGDYIKINFQRYIRRKYGDDDLRSEMPTKNDVTVVIPEVEIDGVRYFHIDENDAVMVVTDWEEVEAPKVGNLIMVEKPEIIMA